MVKIKNFEEIEKISKELKKQGKKIVTTNGCFDLLHIGHMRYLKNAKEQGDILILGLNSDKSIRKLKGKFRPIIPEKERAEILSCLECVNYVVIFDELIPTKFISLIKPNIHVKGGDYNGRLIEQNEVEKHGGEVKIVPVIKNCSTTSIINKIIEDYR